MNDACFICRAENTDHIHATSEQCHDHMYQTIEATIVGGQVEANSDNSEEK